MGIQRPRKSVRMCVSASMHAGAGADGGAGGGAGTGVSLPSLEVGVGAQVDPVLTAHVHQAGGPVLPAQGPDVRHHLVDEVQHGKGVVGLQAA